MASLISADPSTALADEIHRIALPARLLQDLQDQSPEALVQPPPAGQAATLVAEAKLALLLRLALAGPPNQRAASAQKLFSLQALPRLAASRVLDLLPEEPGFGASGPSGSSLRQRLHQILTPALRLVLALATALPHSAAVREQTAAFVVSHERALARILRDAASSGVRGWEPSDAELDEATLVTQIVCELAPHKGLLPPQVAPSLQEAAYRASSRYLASNAKSQSPPVVRVAAAKDNGAPSQADQRTYAKYEINLVYLIKYYYLTVIFETFCYCKLKLTSSLTLFAEFWLYVVPWPLTFASFLLTQNHLRCCRVPQELQQAYLQYPQHYSLLKMPFFKHLCMIFRTL